MNCVLWFSALLVGVVVSEFCEKDNTTSCAHEVCYDEQVPTCDSGFCTCGPKPTGSTSQCHLLKDCNHYWSSHHCQNSWRHCIDGRCVCQPIVG